MTDVVSVRIETVHPGIKGSASLEALSLDLQQELEMSCTLERKAPEEGALDGGLVVAIAIVGLALNAIDTLLSVLQYYKERNQTASVTISSEGYSYTLSDLTNDQAKQIIREIEEKKLRDIIIKV